MTGSVRSSAGLVWRHQRLIWWIFVVNLVLAWLSSLPARVTLGTVLDHSLESAKLVAGFDLGTLALMFERPDVSPGGLAPTSVMASLIFFIYLLFIDGGVFTVFLDDRKMNRAEFFDNAGLFFWRMLRLALYSLVPFGLLALAHSAMNGYAGKLSSDAPQDRLGFVFSLTGTLAIGVAALFVRMWFDLTQARVVRDNERKLLRVLLHDIKFAFTSSKLFVSYIGIALFATVTLGAGVGIWMYLPHRAMVASFFVLELVTIVQIASRIWLKAASARWVALMPEEVTMAWIPNSAPVPDTPPTVTADATPPLPNPEHSE